MKNRKTEAASLVAPPDKESKMNFELPNVYSSQSRLIFQLQMFSGILSIIMILQTCYIVSDGLKDDPIYYISDSSGLAKPNELPNKVLISFARHFVDAYYTWNYHTIEIMYEMIPEYLSPSLLSKVTFDQENTIKNIKEGFIQQNVIPESWKVEKRETDPLSYLITMNGYKYKQIGIGNDDLKSRIEIRILVKHSFDKKTPFGVVIDQFESKE